MKLSRSARRVVRPYNVVKSAGASLQQLCYPISRRALSKTCYRSDNTPVLRYGNFAQKKPASQQAGVVVRVLGESGITRNTSTSSDSGKGPDRASRHARLLSAIQVARQVDKNTSTTKVQDSEILHVSTAEASYAPSAFETHDTSASPQAFVVENNNDVPVSRHSQLAKRMWATRREQVLSAIQEEQAALIRIPFSQNLQGCTLGRLKRVC